MNGSPRVEVHADAGELATSVAGELLRVLAGAQAAGRIPHVVLTGGSIADAIHREVARLSAASGVDWGSVELWWGDERFVARDSADRNAVQAREAFLDAVGVAEHRVHEVAATGEAADVEAAAAAYADELAAHGPDEFDVLMLGVGPDGHIASLFPDRAELAEVDRPTVPVTDSPKPPPERVSLTYPTLARSRATWLLVSGEPKAEAVARALSPAGTTVEETPASGVSGREETVWFLDRDAASRL
ncbi:6-phosphogluconolactonase [uncultured Nocardioides sp.]|uniref:6-phosphogluconolactonase n=1 Tax=uncultured Nocardioides sp. TaxID=198441 RepID=UPI00260F70F1|nr:6-phosphogluconolactonase [uncultured Nocardioides sp.]